MAAAFPPTCRCSPRRAATSLTTGSRPTSPTASGASLTQYQTQGPDYISALLQGYKDPPQGFKIEPGQNYNEVFAAGNGIIAMPPPLQDGVVEYPKGPDGKPVVPETVQQYSKDVAAFLMWVAEPKLDQRKRIGLEVMIFLLVAAGLMYFVKKKVWAEAHA